MRNHLNAEDASLAIQLYLSANEDVDVIAEKLLKLQEEYFTARSKATMGSVAEKFDVSRETIGNILKRNGIPRHKCSAIVAITKYPAPVKGK